MNRADLMRVPGVGSEYSDLLEAGGVDTVKELRRRNAENLYDALRKVNQRKKLVRRLPDLGRGAGLDRLRQEDENDRNLLRPIFHPL